MKELYTKLLEIQKEVDSFTKDKKGFNYSYTTGNQVLSKIRPKMNELGLLLKQEVISVENERIDYVTGGQNPKDKSEILSSVAQKFTWIDSETGQKEECLWHGNGMNDWDKGLGSALTYGERYFLLKFFHVPTDEDDNDNRQDNSGFAKDKNDNKDWLNATNKDGTLNKTGLATVKRLASGKATWKTIYDNCKVSTKDKEAIQSQVDKVKQ